MTDCQKVSHDWEERHDNIIDHHDMNLPLLGVFHHWRCRDCKMMTQTDPKTQRG